jgi:hypothetical protein
LISAQFSTARMQLLTSYRLLHRLLQELRSSKDHFSLRPAKSDNVYFFTRRDVPGSGGRLHSCKLDGIDDFEPTSDRGHYGLVTTVEENTQRFTKREVAQALKARELLGRTGFPSIARAIQMVEAGSNFDVTSRDFKIAESIFGSDATSIKGKEKEESVADSRHQGGAGSSSSCISRSLQLM